MRVISGSARGKLLLPVPGMATRPTTDRIKENIFNIIQSEVRGANVLDLFAGTGQMGIEALSRGAAHCDFVDRDRAALSVIRKNVQGARVGERAAVHASEAAAFLRAAARQSYDLVFLDPPYGGKLLNQALFDLERFDKWYNDMRECGRGRDCAPLWRRQGTALWRDPNNRFTENGWIGIKVL